MALALEGNPSGAAVFDTRGSHCSPARQYVVLVTSGDLDGASVHSDLDAL